ncbi:hypothetical protein CANARDRAFT_27521 [[Candida] arabinofermentans NRRL YB-2248]|uniref:Uncharacterized protein n=1 Tax=[Candida] arabinofermentans NRRL YB-2248 TaxID=983967 RepID=A0A1E4T3E0_9ASCO|nr:hypothetical protein CANARDRAFT_27521 [[Candida] arabinofermentans NRRL YB-2248]
MAMFEDFDTIFVVERYKMSEFEKVLIGTLRHSRKSYLVKIVHRSGSKGNHLSNKKKNFVFS